MDNLFKGVRTTASGLYKQFTHALSPFINNLDDDLATVSRVNQNVRDRASHVGATLSTYLNQTANKAVTDAQAIKIPPIQVHPMEVVKSLSKFALDQPIINVTPAAASYKALQQSQQLPIKSPTIGQSLKFLDEILVQPVARAGMEYHLSKMGVDKNTNIKPQGKVGELLFGDKPLQTYSNPNRPSRVMLRSAGLSENQTNAIAPFMIGLGVIGDVLPVSGEKKVLEKGGEKLLSKAAKEEALHTLKGLLSYEDELAKRGFTAEQRSKYSLTKAKELFQWDTKSAEDALEKARYFATEKRDNFNKLFSRWIGEREVGKSTAVEIGSKFKEIPANLGQDIIRLIENPNASVNPEAGKYIKGIRQEYNSLFSSAKNSGLDIGYLKNYITHIWDRPIEQVEEMYRTAKQSFGFAKDRTYPTYEEGIKMELIPKYNHPAEIIAHYSQSLEQTKANLNFIEGLKKEGIIVDAAVGRGKLGFSPITGNGFPSSVSRDMSGDKVVGSYYAPTEIAEMVNKLFAPEDKSTLSKVFKLTGGLSQRIQDVTLSGGLPHTPFNAFSLTAGLQKEFLAGRFGSTVDFLRSFSAGKTDDFFKANVQTIKDMQLRNIPIQTTFDIAHLVDKGLVGKLLGEGKMGWFDSAMNEPTFKRFFPQLQISLFNDIKNSALKAGKDAEDAADIAAAAVKKFYGVVGTDEMAKRGQLGQDVLSTVFFAPKFRESMINIWKESAKAISPVARKEGKFVLNNPLSLENRTNTFFILGSIATYVAFDQLNYHFTGKHMKDNPDGTEDKLLIPIAEITGSLDDKTVIGIPYLSSLATVPRAIGGMIKHGSELDFPKVTRDAKAFASSLVRTPLDIATNENFFGQPVYDQNGTAGEKAASIGRYAFENYQHPYIRAISELGGIPFIPKKDQPAYQTALKAMEVPVKFYTTDSMQAREYFAVKDEVLKSLSPEDKAVYETLAKKNTEGLRQTMAEAQLRLANPTVLQAETRIAQDTGKRTGQFIDPFYQLPEPNQRMVLTIQAMEPGNSTKSQLTKENIGWLQEYWNAREDFFADLNKDNPDAKAFESSAPSETISKKLDYYYSLPSGTGQRTAYSKANPDLVAYWDASTKKKNDQRLELGLPALPENNFSSGSGRTARAKQPKKISVKMPKIKKMKAMKPLKLKISLRPLKAKYKQFKKKFYA